MPSLDLDAAVVRSQDYIMEEADDRLRPLCPGTSSTSTTSMCPAFESISADDLWASLHQKDEDGPVVVLLDCRSPVDFAECHIRQAVHLSLPSIMLRRLAAGKVTITSVFKCNEARDKLAQAYNNTPASSRSSSSIFVLCAGTMMTDSMTSLATASSSSAEAAGEDRYFHQQQQCQWSSLELMSVLYKTLMQDGCHVACLQGGVEEFRAKYPEWCVTRKNQRNSASLVGNLRLGDVGSSSSTPSTASLGNHLSTATSTFRTSSSSSGPSLGSLGSRSASESEDEHYSALAPTPSSSSSLFHSQRSPSLILPFYSPDYESELSLGLSVGLNLGYGGAQNLIPEQDAERAYLDLDPDPDPGFPVEILPHLFLGNAQNSQDQGALLHHQILNVVNVTPDLPNVFQETGKIQYLQIPITDHLSQNLASHFPSAITFIEEAREREEGVLVHCVGGISRSVTITVAYLMYKLSMNLNDAYDFVRRRKANISPNFNFMGQLLDFERQLTTRAPCTCGATSSANNSLNEHQEQDEPSSLTLTTTTTLSSSHHATLDMDSALPSSVSLSPCSTSSPTPPSSSNSSASTSSAASPSFKVPEEDQHHVRSTRKLNKSANNSGGTTRNLHKRLRAMACQCQAAQCHFSSPVNYHTEST